MGPRGKKIKAHSGLQKPNRVLDFGDQRFDLITCFEVLEHLSDAGRLLALAARWLQPDGRLICSTPNQEVVPFDVKQFPYHDRHYTVEQLEDLVHTLRKRQGISEPTDE